MKKHVMAFLLTGLTSLSFAQTEIAALESSTHKSRVSSSETTNVTSINMKYSSTFSNNGLSSRIKQFQNAVANYDIRLSPVYYSKSNENYIVDFKDSKNKVSAVYNKKGQLLSCEEHYKDVILPYAVASKIVQENPNWGIKAVDCTIVYLNENQKSSIEYKVLINNKNKTKLITVML